MPLAIARWVWHSETTEGAPAEWWEPPAGAIGAVDTRTQPDRIVRGQYLDHPYSVFLFPDDFSLPSEYERIEANQLGRDTWQALLGHSPEGDTPERMLYHHLLAGDPADLDRCKPLMPSPRRLELWLGNRLQVSEPFRYGVHPHTSTVRAMGRRSVETAHKLFPVDTVRRALDYELEKYGLRKSEWEEFVPPSLRSELRGPLPHETRITDDFNRADNSISLGTSAEGWSWDNVLAFNRISNNTAVTSTAPNTDAASRAEINLSGSDQRAELDIVEFGSNSSAYVAVSFRHSSSAYTCYQVRRMGTSASNHLRIDVIEAGTRTQLDASASQPSRIAGEAESSTIRSFNNTTQVAAITNTAIPSGLRTGLAIRAGGITGAFSGDNFVAEDIAASGQTVAPDDSHHGHTSTEATILTLEAVQPDDAWHAQHSTQATVTQEHLVAPHDSWHAQWADETTLLQAGSVVPDDSWHGHTSDEATIAQAGTVSPDDSWHGHTSTEAGVTTVHIVAPDDSWHQQWADEVTVSQDVPGPITVPNVSWQHWGPILLMMDEGGGAVPVAGASSIAWEIPMNELTWAIPDNALFWEVEA